MARHVHETHRDANTTHPRICVDRVIPAEYQPARSIAERAILERVGPSRGGALPLLDGSAVAPVSRAALVLLKRWDPGQSVRCRFLDGTTTQQRKVAEKAAIWEDYANISIQFVKNGDAEIRISFAADPGSWSAIGTDALNKQYFVPYQPTMNFGWLRDDTDDQEYERVVVHEFGHALGLIHEHQSPAERLQWDSAAVYRTFSGPPNYWSKAEIETNILEKYSPKGLQFTDFDEHSIMLYQFDAALFTDHRATPLNYQLSDKDKAFIAQMYPRAA